MTEPASQSELEKPFDRPTGLHPLLWLAGIAGIAFLARVLLQWNENMPLCGFREMTGVPCPLCGGTRTLKSIAEFDLTAAIQFNPLVLVTFALVMVWAVWKLLERILGTRFFRDGSRTVAKLPLAFIVFGALLLNWIYLIYHLP